jgi:hypothetical protein
MTIIVTALSVEATPLIKYFDLKLIYNKPFNIYQNENISLIISGIGSLNSAMATTFVLSKIDDNIDKIINFGICGAKRDDNISIGDIFLINKIVDFNSKKEFFPDILLKHNFKENSITTFDKPVDTYLQFDTTLVDMEVYGFVQASLKFLSTYQIMVIKIVSDFLEPIKFNKDFILDLITDKLEFIDEFIQKYQIDDSQILSDSDKIKIDTIANNLKLSFTQKVQLSSNIKYFNCKNSNKK